MSTAKTATTKKQGQDFGYIIIYFLEWLTGILFFVIAGRDRRKKIHSIQAIVLGIIAVVIAFIPIGIIAFIIDILIWLFGIYIGYMASTGVDVEIPVIADLAKRYAQ